MLHAGCVFHTGCIFHAGHIFHTGMPGNCRVCLPGLHLNAYTHGYGYVHMVQTSYGDRTILEGIKAKGSQQNGYRTRIREPYRDLGPSRRAARETWHAFGNALACTHAYSIWHADSAHEAHFTRLPVFYAPESLETREIQANPERTDVHAGALQVPGEMYRCRAGTVKGYAAGTARTDVMPVFGRQQGQKQVQMNVQK